MNKKELNQEQDEDVRNVTAALKRAGLRAREIAAQTNTPLVFFRDGKIVKEYPTLQNTVQEKK